MAKSRAQRKAEKRAREAEERGQQATGDSAAPEGDVDEEPRGLESKQSRREQRQAEKRKKADQKRQEDQLLAKREKQAQATRKRSGVVAFLSQSAAELKRVQWPDRDTLLQASFVTLLFAALFALYLGLLDLAFNWIVQRVL